MKLRKNDIRLTVNRVQQPAAEMKLRKNDIRLTVNRVGMPSPLVYLWAMRQWDRSVKGNVLIFLNPVRFIHSFNKETEIIFLLGSLINW